ncbi:molybdate ABC transporter substrate-binding protein [Clostridium estertheticum]|uniref:molybdate ABC transporter substrate-binding protein n=1 Tax=Clostridium estertheticum TaxID=238834 RepID=UPI0013EE72C8|nr:molybdate ABC transporter substrate-binding protein [Clostridium estertheticum]MBZ9606780.1 molybdate ABC transporter substrate-binding protein [Clostridium estertheticum]
MKKRLVREILIVMTLLLIMLSGGCKAKQADKASKQEIIVLAASSLTESLEEIIKLFEKENPKVKVTLNLDSTSRLRVQIEQGIKADLFLSANKEHYDALKEEGYISEGEAFLHNSMVLIVPKSNPAEIEKLDDLQNKCKLVIAQKEVPAGEYTRKIIHSLNQQLGTQYEGKVLSNIVSEESNVKQVVNKVVIGEADAAFVYSSDITKGVRDKVKIIDIDPKHNVEAEYWTSKLKNEEENKYAEELYSFLLSKEGKEIFRKYGFNSAKQQP